MNLCFWRRKSNRFRSLLIEIGRLHEQVDHLGNRYIEQEQSYDELQQSELKTLQRLKECTVRLDQLRATWVTYVAYLQKKYPAAEGQDWEFTCLFHRTLNDLLNQEV